MRCIIRNTVDSHNKPLDSATESKREKFPIEPCQRSYTMVRNYLDSINYAGPVGLSCDDTKLFAAFRPYWNAIEDTYYVVGCTGLPLRIANIEEFQHHLQRGQMEKATKVSLIFTHPLTQATHRTLASSLVCSGSTSQRCTNHCCCPSNSQ